MRTLADSCRFVIARLNALGLPLPPQSRFEKLTKLVLADGPIVNRRTFESIRQAMKDIREMDFILATLFNHNPSTSLLEMLDRSLKDDVFPIRTARDAAGRNAQAELYAGAILQNANLSPQKCDPPDFLFTFESTTWALEVKRLQSTKQLEKRLRAGFDALESAGATGLLLLDVSHAIRCEPSPLLRVMPEAQFRQIWGNRLRDFVKCCCPVHRLRALRKGREIRGVILHDHLVFQAFDKRMWLHSLMFGVGIDEHNSNRMQEFDRVFDVFQTGTATPVNNDLIP